MKGLKGCWDDLRGSWRASEAAGRVSEAVGRVLGADCRLSEGGGAAGRFNKEAVRAFENAGQAFVGEAGKASKYDAL